MKKLLILTTLIFTVMFSSPSYSEWKKVSKSVNGDVFYVDFERIRKHGGYVYFWRLSDYLKPKTQGTLSAKTYTQGDCKLFRFKTLSEVYYKQKMGRGTGKTNTQNNPKWGFPHPNSSYENILKSVCSR